MKSELSFHLLQPRLNNLNSEKGFTLIEFLVFLFILSILSAIALPSFLTGGGGCGNQAKQSEGKQYISSINKGQQAYYAENSKFSKNIADLGLGIKTETTNYNYSIETTQNAAFSYAVPRNDKIKAYVGGVFLIPIPATNTDPQTKTIQSILCERNSGSTTKPATPTIQKGEIACGAGTTEVTK